MTEDSIKASVEEATSVKLTNRSQMIAPISWVHTLQFDGEKVGKLPEEKRKKVEEGIQNGKQGSLASVAIFPFFMLACYIALILYFKNKGGYKPVEL